MFICMIYSAIYRFKRALFLYTLVDIKYDFVFYAGTGCINVSFVILYATRALNGMGLY